MGYFERALISNDYFEGAVASNIPIKVLGFHNIQHDILFIRVIEDGYIIRHNY
jgi:hypothetical protein